MAFTTVEGKRSLLFFFKQVCFCPLNNRGFSTCKIEEDQRGGGKERGDGEGKGLRER